MAIGRRKRVGNGTLTTSLTTILTAGTAPTDGSAKLTLRLALCNYHTAAVTVDVTVAGKYLLKGFPIPSGDTYVHPDSIDLMGGETLQALASVASVVDWHAFGVEAANS